MKYWILNRLTSPHFWLGVAIGTVLYALLASLAHGNELPTSPAPKEPVKHGRWLEKPSTLALFLTVAELGDIQTSQRNFSLGGHEQNPLARAVAGPRPSVGAMAGSAAAEIGISYLLARKFPKLRWLQVGLTISHGSCAIHNVAVR